MERDDLKKLALPFNDDDLEWRPGQVFERNGGWRALAMPYVSARAVMKRLDDVCGVGNWKNEFGKAVNDPTGNAVECGISIKIDGEWVTKHDASDNTDFESVKGGYSKALVRAGVQWGIGRYLYALDRIYWPCEVKQSQGKTVFRKWTSPPRLDQKAPAPNPNGQQTNGRRPADAGAKQNGKPPKRTGNQGRAKPAVEKSQHVSEMQKKYDTLRSELRDCGPEDIGRFVKYHREAVIDWDPVVRKAAEDLMDRYLQEAMRRKKIVNEMVVDLEAGIDQEMVKEEYGPKMKDWGKTWRDYAGHHYNETLRGLKVQTVEPLVETVEDNFAANQDDEHLPY